MSLRILFYAIALTTAFVEVSMAGDYPPIPNLFKKTLELWDKREASDFDKITGTFRGRSRAIPESARRRAANPPTPFQSLIRAGKPHRYAAWARCANDSQYCGYFVGGGAPWFGHPRDADEGTWGWDYTPWYSRVRLGWWHGRRFQGGEGQYQPDRKNNPLRDFIHP